MLALVCWLAWNLYSGNLWIRNVAALVSGIIIFNSLFLMLGGALAGEPLFIFGQLLTIAFYAGLVYVLFFYEPVQQYFRYIGGETF